MSDKYPGVSPYAYCANNPVVLKDPNGKTIVIMGEDGEYITYSSDIKYTGSDRSIQNKINILNKINDTKSGRKVIKELCKSENTYCITDKRENGPFEAHFCANDDVQGRKGGMIVTNGYNNLNTISHELFHGYQDEKGQGGASIHNEVEAMIFEFSVIIQSEGGINPIKGDNKAYNAAVDKLFTNYTNENMENVVNGFKLFARGKDTYKNYPIQRSNQKESLIKDFYPLY